METPKEKARSIAKACSGIMSAFSDVVELRNEMDEIDLVIMANEIIQEQCEKNSVKESHVRKIMEIKKLTEFSQVVAVSNYDDEE
jgi:hypothetical protein